MAGKSSQNINPENNFRNGKILFYISIFIGNIIKFILRREEKRNKNEKKYYFNLNFPPNIFPYFKNSIYEIKNKSIMSIIVLKTKKINIKNNKIKENKKKKRKDNINDNNLIIRYNTLIILIKLIIINIFCQIKSNILFDSFHFQ